MNGKIEQDTARQQATGPGTLIGPFLIEAEIGSGAFGIVYRAHDDRGRTVVVKLLRQELSREPLAARRYQQEIALLRSLRHPNVVRFLGTGEHRGAPYFVMEHVVGESLAEALRRQRVLPLRQVLQIGKEIAMALAEAHERNILHRDLKPGNILLTGEGRAKLADFGLAKRLDASAGITASGVMLGTPAYMSPEQIRGQALDGRSDLYALGIILYQMLLGLNPFLSPRDLQGTMARHLRIVPPRVDAIRKDVPRTLADLVSDLLEKSRHKRPQSAFAVMAQLERILRCEERPSAAAAQGEAAPAAAPRQPAPVSQTGTTRRMPAPFAAAACRTTRRMPAPGVRVKAFDFCAGAPVPEAHPEAAVA